MELHGREYLSTLAAGQEIDTLVAQLVFGFWQARHPDSYMADTFGAVWWGTLAGGDDKVWVHASCCGPEPPRLEGSDLWANGLPRYSTRPAPAFQIIRKLRASHPSIVLNDVQPPRVLVRVGSGKNYELQSMEDGQWYCAFFKHWGGISSGEDGHAKGETIELAICRAALMTTLEKEGDQ